ncbi:MAG: BglI family type II restriction endonuclease [Selenomonadaceae bacterium]|nr:BglI family type II restriction endonuclease [Selenomonadaceae bacterium]
MNNKQNIEETEQAAMRLVVRAIKNFFPQAKGIFRQETDLPQDVAEDCTAEAMQSLGASNLRHRLFGKIDYKKAIWLFFPDREQAVALFVDSKAEKPEGAGTATIQLTQTSLEVRMIRNGQAVNEQGLLPTKISSPVGDLQVITIFVKYVYIALEHHGYDLKNIIVFCIPSGELQAEYNPNEYKGFWRAGRNAPSRGEEFRVRVKLSELKEFADWRVVKIN